MERTRTIGRIKQSIIDNATENIPGLSTSNTAEWKLWASIVATAIHAFELIMELFAKEIDALTTRITPGTIRWYAEMCKRFQNGDTLAFDTETALLYYPKKDPAKQIIAVAAVSEKQDTAGAVSIKVAKKDAQGHIVELSPSELYNFKNYIDSIKFAGSRTEVNSTKADLIYYDLTVYHDTTKSSEEISGDITKALEQFKVSIDFDGVLYRQKLLDAVMDVAGVTTCALNALEQHTYKDQDPSVWHSVDTHALLESGYFDWADDSESEQTEPEDTEQKEPEDTEQKEPETPESPETPETPEETQPDEKDPETDGGDSEPVAGTTEVMQPLSDLSQTETPEQEAAAKKVCRLTVKPINELLNPKTEA